MVKEMWKLKVHKRNKINKIFFLYLLIYKLKYIFFLILIN
jgi:hypothetical protein